VSDAQPWTTVALLVDGRSRTVGRLDPEHTPSGFTDPRLAGVRQAFQGF
jgi:hypothetical protein